MTCNCAWCDNNRRAGYADRGCRLRLQPRRKLTRLERVGRWVRALVADPQLLES